jgi:hypothetical protein
MDQIKNKINNMREEENENKNSGEVDKNGIPIKRSRSGRIIKLSNEGVIYEKAKLAGNIDEYWKNIEKVEEPLTSDDEEDFEHNSESGDDSDASVSSEEEEEDEEDDERPVKKSKKTKRVEVEEDDERPVKKSKKTKKVEAEEEDEEADKEEPIHDDY